MLNGAQRSGLSVSVRSVPFLDHSDPYFGQFSLKALALRMKLELLHSWSVTPAASDDGPIRVSLDRLKISSPVS